MSSLRKFSEEEDQITALALDPWGDGQDRMVDGIIQVNEGKGGFGSKVRTEVNS